jgi:hypothetical protein
MARQLVHEWLGFAYAAERAAVVHFINSIIVRKLNSLSFAQ